MSRNDIKNNQSNNDKRIESRSNRNDDRDSGQEIILPDGRKLIRRATENLGALAYKLSAPKKEGFYRRWVSDEIDGKIQHYINLGFVPATNELGEQFQARRGGNKKSGQEYNMYLLEIPTEKLEKLKSRYKELDSGAKALEMQKKWLEDTQESEDSEVHTYKIKSSQKEIELR